VLVGDNTNNGGKTERTMKDYLLLLIIAFFLFFSCHDNKMKSQIEGKWLFHSVVPNHLDSSYAAEEWIVLGIVNYSLEGVFFEFNNDTLYGIDSLGKVLGKYQFSIENDYLLLLDVKNEIDVLNNSKLVLNNDTLNLIKDNSTFKLTRALKL